MAGVFSEVPLRTVSQLDERNTPIPSQFLSEKLHLLFGWITTQDVEA